MAVQIGRERLLGAIRTVLPAVARKELFEQADKLAIDGGHLVSYNDAVSIMHPLPELDGISGSIDGRKLFELLGRVPTQAGADPAVDLDMREGELLVSCAKTKTRASFFVSPVTLPISEIDQTGDYMDLPDGFTRDLGMVAAAGARTDVSRHVLMCVRLDGSVIEASDGYRMARLQLDGDVLPSTLLPITSAALVSQVGATSVAMGETGDWIRFKTDEGTILCARTASGVYPRLDDLYDVTGAAIALPGALRSTIERALVFARRDNRIDEEVQVTMSPGKIVVRAAYGGGKFSETIPHRDQDAEGSFSIHPSFLMAALDERSTCVLGESKIKFSTNSWSHVIALR